jgi:hypothetical protein
LGSSGGGFIISLLFLNRVLSSMMEHKAHLILILLFRQHLSCVWDGTNFLLNLFISIFNLSSCVANTFLNFLFYTIEFGILLLDLQGGFQLVDFWDLSNNLTSLLLESLDHGHVELTWLMLQEHLVNGGLDGVGLVGDILLKSSDVGLNGLELGDGEANTVKSSVDQMLLKHQPSELDMSMIKGLEEKGGEIIAQIPKINQLEATLEIQEEDAELDSVKKKIQKSISNTRAQIENGNK